MVYLRAVLRQLVLKCLHHFTYCEDENFLDKSPVRKINLPADDKVNDKKKFLVQSDVKTAIASYEDDNVDFIYLFALMTSLRQGEILRLKHKDIDIDEKMIIVNKALSQISSKGMPAKFVIKSTKNTSSERFAVIRDYLIEPLKNHVRTEKTKHLKLGKKFSSDTMLFTNEICDYGRRSHISRKWKKTQIALNIEPVNFHGLRHTFATLLALINVNVR